MPRAVTKPVISKKALTVHNAIAFDKNNPLPITFGGTVFTTMDGYQYYPFFHPDDNLFRTLLEARLLSPTHSNCINDKTFYTVGDGLQVMDQEFPKDFDKYLNKKRQTIDRILKAVSESYYQDGNKFIEIARTTVLGQKYVHVYPHNNLDCRLKQRDDGEDPTHVIRTKLFRRDGIYNWTDNDKPVCIPLWVDDPSMEVWLQDGDVERTMLHVTNEIQGVDYYGLPSFYAGFINILLEYKATSFNLDNFDNNMFLAGLLFIQGNMAQAEEKKFLQNLKKMYTGLGKGKRILPISSEGGLTDTKFVPFNNREEGHFMEFDRHNIDKIVSAHSWSKDLLDIKETSSFGRGGEYLKQLFKIKFRTVISPTQQLLLNDFIFPLMKIIDDWKGTNFYDLPWHIKPVIPVSLEAILDINSLLTVDEGREEIGMKPSKNSKKGKLQISEITGKSPTGPGAGNSGNQDQGGSK